MEAVLIVFFQVSSSWIPPSNMVLFSSKLMSLQSVGFVLFLGLSVLDELVWDTSMFIEWPMFFLKSVVGIVLMSSPFPS